MKDEQKCAGSAPAVVLPERRPQAPGAWGDMGDAYNEGVNDTIDEVIRLNPAAAQVPAKMQWPEIVQLVNEVLGCEAHALPCKRGHIGHEMTGINFNSLARIIDRVQASGVQQQAEQVPVEVGEVRVSIKGGHKHFEFDEYGAAYLLSDGLHHLYTAAPAQGEHKARRPTGLSQGWNLTRQCDGFVIGHQSREPSQSQKDQALADGRVFVPFLVTQVDPAQDVAGLVKRMARFVEVVRECERLASSYCGTLDGVEEHGGDDHEDPTCAIWHRLYYAMFDADAALADYKGGAA